jgi:hypothetical protein
LRKFLGYDISYAKKQEELVKTLQNEFKLDNVINIEKTIFINKETATSLIKMTPIFWKIDQSLIEKIGDMQETINFNVLSFSKN